MGYKYGEGWTVAMMAANDGHIKDLPRRYYHDPLISDNDGWTVAMFMISGGYIDDLSVEF